MSYWPARYHHQLSQFCNHLISTQIHSRCAIRIINTSSAGPVYLRYPNMAISVPAGALAPNGAKPTPGTMMNVKSDMSSFEFLSVHV